MEVLTQAIWAIAPGIVVGIVMAFWNKRQKHMAEKDEAKEQDRIESEMLQIDLEVAAAQLAYAVAMAYKRGTPNGEMETAISQYEKAMKRFREFERKQMAKSSLE